MPASEEDLMQISGISNKQAAAIAKRFGFCGAAGDIKRTFGQNGILATLFHILFWCPFIVIFAAITAECSS